MYVIGFLLVLGPLVTLHELGHYLVGRWFGVGAEAFSIGFGRELIGWTDKRGTRWKIAAIPLGGYVQFKGDMNPASIPDAEAIENASPEEREGSFHHASLWKRALIVFAGPATNIIVTIAIFAAFFTAMGRPVALDPAETTVVNRFADVSVARDAGIEEGDRILAIDGEKVATFQDITDKVMLYPNKRISIDLERDGNALTVPVTIGEAVESDRFGNEMRMGRLGIYSQEFKFETVGPIVAVGLAAEHSVDLVRMMVTGIVQIVTGDRSLQEMGGPIKIAKYSGEQLSLGPLPFINFIALISLNLAFINLLPIPALDGGHLAFYAAEAVRKKPVSPRGMEWAYRTGVALVLMLMVVVTVNDLVTLPIFGS
ncbi:Membrane-associated zinc metalloprotease [Altererythrobacter epoxidivorans]|uniref:Zinc metalloprotease n=2 Tax=Altererythrobacter epoxidivorans TaxID=361183 RepID=A0A0M4LU05_9SPHN|nr:Membrane-associated zinc metalloprotease [Altererythrobacter epoxidivorans]